MSESVTSLLDVAKTARSVGHILQTTTLSQRNNVLEHIATLLPQSISQIRSANQLDLQSAKLAVDQGKLSLSTYNRLDMLGPDGKKLDSLIQGVHDVIKLDDPLNEITLSKELDTGLDLYRVTCPIGVLLIIFEARPEVVIQISCLAIKSGNAVILKGGKEATHSLRQLHEIIQLALHHNHLPKECVQIIYDRHSIDELLQLDKYIDLVIPRGSSKLIKYIKDNTRIPVLGHADGICSIYLDKELPVEYASKIIIESKTQYPAACNAIETMLIHHQLLITDIEPMKQIIRDLLDKGVILKCDTTMYSFIEKELSINDDADDHDYKQQVQLATANDWDMEYLDLIIAIKVVNNINEAIQHISDHGSGHTDVILTKNSNTANRFLRQVDSAGVYWNASSRFADGYRYSFGCEVGVSTNRIHARGPVGIHGLVCYKYRLHGSGHIISDYGTGIHDKQYLHRDKPITDDIKLMVSGGNN